MDANFYVGILEQRLPEIRRLLGDRWRFQQDNDSKHTSRTAKEFLRNNVPMVLDWPPTALILILSERRKSKNCKELERFTTEEWDNIPNTVLINLIDSMKHRCELIIEYNGDGIPY